MKTFVTLRPGSEHQLVQGIQAAFSAAAGVDVVRHLDQAWRQTLSGYQTEFDHQLRGLPPVLSDAPITMIVVQQHTYGIAFLQTGVHEPEGANVRAQVTSYGSEGEPVFVIRVETIKIGAPTEMLTSVNRYFDSVVIGQAQPTTVWTPPVAVIERVDDLRSLLARALARDLAGQSAWDALRAMARILDVPLPAVTAM